MNMKYLKDNFYLGGYYIVQPTPIKNWMNKDILPKMILSASECICKFYPNIYKLKSKKYRKEVMLDKKVYFEMISWIQNKSETDLEYSNTFCSYENVIEFYKKFLSKKNNLKIIGIAIPKGKWRKAFLEDDSEDVIFDNIRAKIDIDNRSKVLGYEILGYDFNGFHSYICNNLYEDYNKKYGFKLNSNGFISTFEEAEKLANYTNEKLDNAEPVFWCPWLILEM